MASIKKETIKGVKWSAFCDYTNTFASFITSIFLARLLEPSDYGIIGMVSIFFILSGIITDSGFSMSLIQKKDANNVDYSTVFYSNIAISLICYFVLYTAAPYISVFLNEPILTKIIRLSGLTLIIGAFGSIQFTLLSKQVNFKTPAFIRVFSNIIAGIIAIILAYNGYGVWTLVIQSLLASFLSVVSIWGLRLWHPILVFSWKSFHQLFSYGSKILITNLLSQAFSNIQNLLIGKFYTTTELGYYTKGHQTSTLPMGPLYGVISKVTLPVMAKIQDNEELLLLYYKKLIKTSSVLVFFFMILLASLSRPCIIFLFSDKWEPSAIYLQLFCLCSMFSHITNSNINLLLAKGYSDLNLKCEIYRKIIWGIALIISLPISVLALCIASTIAAQGSVLINTYYTGKLFKYGYIEQWKDFYHYIIFSIIASIPAYMLSTTNINPFITILIGGITAIIIYITILWYRKDEGLKEFISLIPASFINKIKQKIEPEKRC